MQRIPPLIDAYCELHDKEAIAAGRLREMGGLPDLGDQTLMFLADTLRALALKKALILRQITAILAEFSKPAE